MASNENKKKPDGIINLDAARKNSKAEPAEKEVEYTIYVPPVIDRITEEIKAFKNDIEAKAKERGDAVSYTHLDVYKRQPLTGTWIWISRIM